MRVCLVLSGSGVNFDAHIGAIKALHHAGVEITEMVAVSGGSLVAAAYALLGEEFEEPFTPVRISSLFKKAPWWKALFKGYLYERKGFETLVRNLFGDMRLADLNIPLTVLASNLETGDPVVFSSVEEYHNAPSDRIYDALLASTAAPLVLPPHLGLYDGGIINNIPIDWVHDYKGVPEDVHIIGVRVVPPRPRPSIKDGSLMRMVSISKAVLDTMLTALDREHVEEHVDDVCFVPVDTSSFDFGINFSERTRNRVSGYERMKNFLEKKFFEILNG